MFTRPSSFLVLAMCSSSALACGLLTQGGPIRASSAPAGAVDETTSTGATQGSRGSSPSEYSCENLPNLTKPGTLTSKYSDAACVGGHIECTPKGPYRKVAADCNLDLDQCDVSFEGASGAFTARQIEMFADLARRKPDTGSGGVPAWVQVCPSVDESFEHNLGIQGLGYARASADAGVLRALIATDPLIKDLGGRQKDIIARSLFWMNAKASAPDLVRMLPTGTGVLGFRIRVLTALSVWKSPAAVPWCKDAFSTVSDGDTLAACGAYLAAMNVPEAPALVLRNVEKMGDDGIALLGRFDDAGGRAYLESKLDRKGRGRFIVQVALASRGRAASVAQLASMLRDSPGESGDCARLRRSAGARPAVVAMLRALHARGAENARALVARARLGDDTAIPQIVAGLSDPNDRVRREYVNGVGAHFGESPSYGVVATRHVYEALATYYRAESDPEAKRAAVVAMMNVRTMLPFGSR